MATCYDCVYLGRRTVGSHKIRCRHPDNRKQKGVGKVEWPIVRIDTPACDKVFLTHRARKVLALEKLASTPKLLDTLRDLIFE